MLARTEVHPPSFNLSLSLNETVRKVWKKKSQKDVSKCRGTILQFPKYPVVNLINARNLRL